MAPQTSASTPYRAARFLLTAICSSLGGFIIWITILVFYAAINFVTYSRNGSIDYIKSFFPYEYLYPISFLISAFLTARLPFAYSATLASLVGTLIFILYTLDPHAPLTSYPLVFTPLVAVTLGSLIAPHLPPLSRRP